MRDGSGWSPIGNSPKGANPPFLKDGFTDGPRIGPRIFIDKLEPHNGGSFLQYVLTGRTLNAELVALPGCTVKIYDTINDVLLQTTVSDGLGAYTFTLSTPTQQCYIVAYLASAPDVYGTTVNTLTGLS